MVPSTSGLSSTIKRIGLVAMVVPAVSVLANQLDLELNRHRVPDEDAAGLKRLVPGEAKVAAVDRGSGGKAGHLETLGIAPATLQLRIERDRAGRPADSQVSVNSPS